MLLTKIFKVFRNEQKILIRNDLIKIYEVIKDKNKWCQRAIARNAQDEIVSIYAKDACKFCLLGAWYLTEGSDATNIFLNNNTKAINYLNAAEFNDHNDHEIVIGQLKYWIRFLGGKV